MYLAEALAGATPEAEAAPSATVAVSRATSPALALRPLAEAMVEDTAEEVPSPIPKLGEHFPITRRCNSESHVNVSNDLASRVVVSDT